MIAGVLLLTNHVSSVDVINLMSRLSMRGISVDDENDDIFRLACCVDMDKYCFFSLRNGFDYQTKLANGNTVSQYLEGVAGSKVLDYLKNDSIYGTLYLEYYKSKLCNCVDYLETVGDVQYKIKKKRLMPILSMLSEFI